MKLRSAALAAALVLLSATSVAGAAPAYADTPASPSLGSLLPAAALTAGGPAQCCVGSYPSPLGYGAYGGYGGYGIGGASSQGYWGGWAFPQFPSGFTYGPFGPYPTPQTASFFQAQSLGSQLFGTEDSFGSSSLQLNPIAPGASLTLQQLQSLGLGAASGNFFTTGGGTFPITPGFTLGNTSLAALVGFPNRFFAGTPFTLGAFGLGLGR